MNQQFPPEGYVPTISAVDGVMVFMQAPEIENVETTVEFACPNCGGITAYSVTDGGLSCTACGYYEPPKVKTVGRSAQANEFRTEESIKKQEDRMNRALGAYGVAASVTADGSLVAQNPDEPQPLSTDEVSSEYDWAGDRQALDCKNCGAQILLEPGTITHQCPFCGSSQVFQHTFAQDRMRPRFIIPFMVEDREAKKTILSWLDESWMTPPDLAKRAGIDELRGLYVPFWTFTALCQATWKAQVGHTQWYTDSDGNRKSRTVWKWENGRVRDNIRDHLVAGTDKLNQNLVKSVASFGLGELKEYDPSFIAGFNAQTYDVDRDRAWEQGRHEMRVIIKKSCTNQASTQKIRNFSMSMDFDDESWRLVLLPVYLTTYRYDDETFQVMVNGQNRTIVGQRPIDWRRVLAAGTASFIPAIILGIIAVLNSDSDAGSTWLIMAVLAGAMAIGASIWLFMQASQVRNRKE